MVFLRLPSALFFSFRVFATFSIGFLYFSQANHPSPKLVCSLYKAIAILLELVKYVPRLGTPSSPSTPTAPSTHSEYSEYFIRESVKFID